LHPNISKNGSYRKVELSDADNDIYIRAAKAVGLEFAGVDIMKDEEGKTYVVEVNGNPGTKIINLTGRNYFVDLVKMVGGKVSKSEQGDAGNRSSNNEIVTTVKSSIFGKLIDPYAHLSSHEKAHVENMKRLKSQYPNLMKGVDI
jgi:predicted ATP-grasp superfamily ATP-dependent carboligase